MESRRVHLNEICRPRGLATCGPLFAQTAEELFRRNIGSREQFNKQFPPHQVIGNIYYVGSESLASFLFVTPQGSILLNSCFEATVPVIRSSVEQLGFKFTDIKILLGSHAHADHMEGDALVKEFTRRAGHGDGAGRAGAHEDPAPQPASPSRQDAERRRQSDARRHNAGRASHRRPHPRLHHLDHPGARKRQDATMSSSSAASA